MAVKEQPVIAVLQTLVCEKCGEEMLVTKALASDPPQYVHRCKNGHEKIENIAYPAIAHKVVKQGEGEKSPIVVPEDKAPDHHSV